MKDTNTPLNTLQGVAARDALRLAAVAADITLVLDASGVIRDVALGNAELAEEGCADWLGKPWRATVTEESHDKVDALLRYSGPVDAQPWRHINHTSPRGRDLPIQYRALPITHGQRVLIGRDLRSAAALQQQLLNNQIAMERDFARLHHLETRYRLLFAQSAEGVAIVNAETLAVIELNPAAQTLLPQGIAPGVRLLDAFDTGSAMPIQAMVAVVRATGKADRASACIKGDGAPLLLHASLFRHERNALLLVRMVPESVGLAPDAEPLGDEAAALLPLVTLAPDALVLTDAAGVVQRANAAFLDLTQIALGTQLIGQRLDQWLGRPSIDLDVLLANLRQHGVVRLYATMLRPRIGPTLDVEVSAVSLTGEPRADLGFFIRNVTARRAVEGASTASLPTPVERLTDLVGRVPLKDLVRDTTDVIERLCIETALDLAKDNRATAAELLGLSRQSLYMKLHRYGLGDLGKNASGSE